MKKITLVCLLFQIGFFSSNAQTLNFRDTTFSIGDQLKRGVLYSPNCQLNLKDIPFLDSLGSFLVRNPHIHITIKIHSDIRGTIEGNQSLTEICGKDRLESFFSRYYPSVNPHRINYMCLGESQPVFTKYDIIQIVDEEEKENAHSKNRRTMIILSRIDENN